MRGFLPLFLAACASSSEPVVLEWHGSDDGLAMARAAADEWMAVCHAPIIVERSNGGAPVEEHDKEVLGSERLGETVTVDGRPASMWVVRYGAERTTLAHEMGHALGIRSHASTGLMATENVRGAGLFHVTDAECAMLP